MLRKLYILLTFTALLLASCAEEYYAGKEYDLEDVIILNTSTGTSTRGGQTTGAAAAELLGNTFFVYGAKKYDADGEGQVVFPHYEVDYVTGSAQTSSSNSAGWEYVGKGDNQLIKYWDFNALSYSFYAYSFGKGDAAGNKASATDREATCYTLSGTTEQLAACYFSDIVTKAPNQFPDKQVKITFNKLGARGRIGVYETIPGYSIRDIRFYSSDATEASEPTLYTVSQIPGEGSYKVSFDTDGKRVLTYTPKADVAAKTTQTFPAITLNATKEYREPDGQYMGRSSSTANISEYTDLLPNATGTNLTMKCDYTLISRDGTGETIKVKGATACIPSAFTQWKPNYSYTYLFKISNNTNGSTGQLTGLYPITLDAVSTDDNEQQTVTTLEANYITTYAKGSDVTEACQYSAGTIYAVIGKGETYESANAKLYIATKTGADGTYVTEEAVANDLQTGTYDPTANTYTIVYRQEVGGQAENVTLVLTEEGAPSLTPITQIPAEATVDGVARSIQGASFTAEAGKTYVISYLKTQGTATAATATYNAAETYFTQNTAGYYIQANITAEIKDDWTNQHTNYYTLPTQPVYAYKVIVVKNEP